MKIFKFKKRSFPKFNLNKGVFSAKRSVLAGLVLLVVGLAVFNIFRETNAQWNSGGGNNPVSHISVNAKIGGAPTGVIQDNLDNLISQADGSYISETGIKITTSASSIMGTWLPYLSGGNGRGFGPNGTDQPDGPDNTPFIRSPRYIDPPVILTLPGDQKYVGLLWGSVDYDNQLSFYKDNTLVGSVAGRDISNNIDFGSPAKNGTYYVNISSDIPFNRLKFRGCTKSSGCNESFEFDNIAFASYVPWESYINKTSEVVDSSSRTAKPGDTIRYTIKYKSTGQ